MNDGTLVHNIQIGTVNAAIFRNHTSHGIFHSVRFETRGVTLEEGQVPQFFCRDELLVLSRVAIRAHTWILDNLDSDIA